MKKGKIVIALLTAIVMIALTGCSGGNKNVNETTKNTAEASTTSATTEKVVEQTPLVYGTSLEYLNSLDIHNTTQSAPFSAAMQIVEPLIGKDTFGGLFPLLLTKMPEVSTDGLVYSFELKSGVRFHDGSSLDATDVRATFEKLLSPVKVSPHAGAFSALIAGGADYAEGKTKEISGIKVVDDLHFTITLNSPNASFENGLSTYQAAIFPAEAASSEEWGTKVFAGTGPYKVKEFEPAVKLTLEKFEDYHKGARSINEIIYKHMDPNTALLEFEAGTIDIAGLSDPALIASYVANPKYKNNVNMVVNKATVAMSFNFKMEPFDDVRVREAVSLSIDRKSIVEKLMKGQASPAKSFLPDGVLGFDKDLAPIEYNPERAKKLLAEAGYPDGITLNAITTETSANNYIIQYLQQSFKDSNITLEIQTMDGAGFNDIRSNGKVPMFILTWASDAGDPHDFMNLYSTPLSQYISNFYMNSEYDASLQSGLSELDETKREEIYKTLDKNLTRVDFACAPILHPSAFFLVSDRVTNLRLENVFRLFDAEFK